MPDGIPPTFGAQKVDCVARWLVVAALLGPMTIAAMHFFLAPPMVSHDTAIGLQVWRAMEAGAPWNHILTTDPTDISRSNSGFLAWWSPGQYLAVGALAKLGLSLGTAALCVSLLAAWSLALGLWRLCLEMGTTSRAASLAAFSGAMTWHTLYAFGCFIGGEVVLIAVWPWIVVAAWRWRKRVWLQTILLPLLFVAGSFAKLSFGIYAFGLLAFLWQEHAREKGWKASAMLKEGLRLGVIAAAYLAIWHWFYTSRGATPAVSSGQVVSVGAAIGFAVNAPWFAAFGAGSVIGRFCASQGLSPEAGWNLLWPALALAGLVVIAGYAWCLRRNSSRLDRLAATVSLVAAVLFAGLLLRGAAVSLEDRHFRGAGILVLAACCGWSLNRRTVVRILTVGVLLVAVAFGTGAAVQRMGNLRKHGVRSAENLSALDIDPAALRYLEMIDTSDKLIALPNVMSAPLVRRGRILTLEAAFRDVGSTALHEWRGRVPVLVVALPEQFEADGRADRIRAGFTDYRPGEWVLVRAGRWCFWQAGGTTGR